MLVAFKGITPQIWIKNHMAKTGCRKSKGFTLVELSVLLALTALMAAIAVPILTDSMHAVQLESDARKIASALSYAKSSAVSNMTSYRLSFDVYGGQWSVSKFNKGLEVPDFELEQDVHELAEGVRKSGIAFMSHTEKTPQPNGFDTTSSNQITFSPRGIPDAQAIVYLSSDETDYAISVSLAGKVQIWKYADNQWIPQ